MKILFITHVNKKRLIQNNYLNDCTLLGLKELYGNDNVIDFPGAWYMYKDEVKKRDFKFENFWGNGFTYYDILDNYESVDRTDIESKIKNNFFNYIVYGSITGSQTYLNQSINSKSKVIFIDGDDHTNLEFNKNEKIIYFKRELNKDIKNVFPINFSIPKSKILNKININPKNLLAPLIPHRYNTYIYKNELDYYKMWQDSIFGITYVHKGWWDALRYYEMLMNGCIPLMLELEKCPKNTLTLLPKDKFINLFKQYSWILSQYFPIKIYKKKFLSIDKFILYFKNLHKKKYDGNLFVNEFKEINNVRQNLLDYTKNFLTTEYSAKYIINTTDKFYS